MTVTTIPTAGIADNAVTTAKAAFSAGKILQVQSTLYNTATTQSITADTDTAINNLSVNITPAASSSKILVFIRLFHESSNTDSQNSGCFVIRDSTPINLGASAGSRLLTMLSLPQNYTSANANSTPETFNGFTIDSPNTTSQITYHVGYRIAYTSTLYINQTVSSTDGSSYERGSSEIIAMEIGA